MTNIMSHRFLTGDRFDDGHQPSTKVLKTVRNGQELFEGNTTMIESLIQNRFVSDLHERFGFRKAKVFQSLDETGVPIIESTIKGRWVFQTAKKKIQTETRHSKDFISRNKFLISTYSRRSTASDLPSRPNSVIGLTHSNIPPLPGQKLYLDGEMRIPKSAHEKALYAASEHARGERVQREKPKSTRRYL